MSKIHIHETAFVTSHFRSENVEVSRDMYADLWPTNQAKKHAKQYTSAVSAHEPLAHCLRNRYFLNKLKELHNTGQLEAVLNFGSGFSMYPFLLPESLLHIEIDKKEVVDYKQAQIEIWQAEGKLPQRKVSFLDFDFKQPSYSEPLKWLSEKVEGLKTFILLEGVLFFLNQITSAKLFNLFGALQQKDSFVGSVSFEPSLVQTPVFQRLITYVEQGLKTGGSFDFYTVSDGFYQNLSGYSLKEKTDSLKLKEEYAAEHSWKEDDVLVENMYLLKKS